MSLLKFIGFYFGFSMVFFMISTAIWLEFDAIKRKNQEFFVKLFWMAVFLYPLVGVSLFFIRDKFAFNVIKIFHPATLFFVLGGSALFYIAYYKANDWRERFEK